RQGSRETNYRLLGAMVDNAGCGEGADGDGVERGCGVEIRYVGDDDVEKCLCGSVEEEGQGYDIVSPGSPLGEAIVGKKVGEKVTYTSPTGATLEVEDVGIE